jgi:hypothetical protein
MVQRVLIGVALLSLLAAGCRKEPMPDFGHVKGVLKAKGKPLKGMIVTFLPDPGQGNNWAINASATTDEQGAYELGYGYKGVTGKGAAVGWNIVTVLDTRYASIPQGGKLPPRLFSIDYGEPSRTPLKIEVKPGENEFNLDVK